MSSAAIDYRASFNEYWRTAESRDYAAPQEIHALVRQIEMGAGYGTVLDLGSGNGRLVQALCVKGLDAKGVDVSDVAVAAADCLCPGRFIRSSVLDLVYPEDHFDIVLAINCLEYLSEEEAGIVLKKIAYFARRAVCLRLAVKSDDPRQRIFRPREWWERLCFETGLRRHPNTFAVMPYDETAEPSEVILLFEPVPAHLFEAFSLSALNEERDLHMDMAREAGSRSDAHLMRYHVAAQYIRPGDRVLDAACGLGYGSHILRQRSLCATVLGLDASDYAVNYAAKNYGEGERVLFKIGSLPHCIDSLEPGSIDFIASFETLEHLENPLEFLSACNRVLSPGGRIMVSVPNDWAEEDGKDPNPHHFHVYNWASLLDQLNVSFMVEKAFCQTANRRKRKKAWIDHGREWLEVGLDRTEEAESEWCIALAMTDPIGAKQRYVDRHHPMRSSWKVPEVLNFGEQYENPWLVPSLIAIGLRTENPDVRLDIARRVLLQHNGADAAAALCVQGYIGLSQAFSTQELEAWKLRASSFINNDNWQAMEPIDLRWAISLLYLQALLERRGGFVDAATASFIKITTIPFLDYSPLIATKVVDAYYELGMAAWIKEDETSSRYFFLKGIEVAKDAVGCRWDEVFGSLEDMPRFVLSELTEILDLATRCSEALKHVGSERLSGKIVSNTLWSRKFELLSVRAEAISLLRDLHFLSQQHEEQHRQLCASFQFEHDRLHETIENYENAKTQWYEPQIASLQAEIVHLNEDLEQSARAKAEWYEPQMTSLQAEVVHLNEDLEKSARAKAEWYEPQIKQLHEELERAIRSSEESSRLAANLHPPGLSSLEADVRRLTGELEDMSKIEVEFYQPQLERKSAYIASLEYEISQLRDRNDELCKAKEEFYEPEFTRLNSEILRVQRELDERSLSTIVLKSFSRVHRFVFGGFGK